MSGDYFPLPEQMPPPLVTHPPKHQPSCDETPFLGTTLSSLADADPKSILFSLPELGGIEGAVYVKAEVAGAAQSVSGDIAFASKACYPLVGIDAEVLGAAAHCPDRGDGDPGAVLGNLISAVADILTDSPSSEHVSDGHQGCLCGEIIQPVFATVLDHVGDVLM